MLTNLQNLNTLYYNQRNFFMQSNISVKFITGDFDIDKNTLHFVYGSFEGKYIQENKIEFSHKKNETDVEFGARIAKLFWKEKYKTFVMDLTSNIEKPEDFVFGFKLRAWEFDKYKKKKCCTIENLVIIVKESFDQKKYQAHEIEYSLEARELCLEPANFLNTCELANKFKELESMSENVSVEIWNEDKLKKENMNLILAVGRGSENPQRLVIVKYNCEDTTKKRIGLVGKGVVFDTGGVCLKGSVSMYEMHGDMGGAAAVFTALKVLIAKNVKEPIIAAIPIVENSISGNAFRVGDIITARNGTTVEITNTDAEGRLILCDAISYICEQNVSHMIDIATLTGAAGITFGSLRAPIFSNNEKYAKQIQEYGEKVHEPLWPMPLDKKYAQCLKSNYADISNSYLKRVAGSIGAAKYLQHFVSDEIVWVHIDIAGMNFLDSYFVLDTDPNIPMTSHGTRILAMAAENFSTDKNKFSNV